MNKIEQQIATMLDMQNDINSKIDPDWKDKERPWDRAIWVEAAEMMDHIGYKWWKHQGIDIYQVQLELVDIWHFALSMYLEAGVDVNELGRVFRVRLFGVQETADREAMLTSCEDFAARIMDTGEFPLAEFISVHDSWTLANSP